MALGSDDGVSWIPPPMPRADDPLQHYSPVPDWAYQPPPDYTQAPPVEYPYLPPAAQTQAVTNPTPGVVPGTTWGGYPVSQHLYDQAQAGTNLAMGWAGTTTPVKGSSILAYHGSPHLFPPTPRNPLGEFSDAAIGTGEGNQSFSRGHYLAEHEGTAQDYRDQLTVKPISPELKAAQDAYNQSYWDVDKAHGGTQQEFDAAIAARDAAHAHMENVRTEWEAQPGPQGHMYQAEINIDPDHMLHWDKPLSEQSPYVQQRLQTLGIDVPQKPDLASITDPVIRSIVRGAQKYDTQAHNLGLTIDNDSYLYNQAIMHAQRNGVDLEGTSPGDYVTDLAHPYTYQAMSHAATTGEWAVRKLTNDVLQGRPSHDANGLPTSWSVNPDHEAAQSLLRAGIPGVRYLDRFSRDTGEGTHNYVVFDPKTINIIKRYGIPGMIAAGADAAREHKAQQ